MAAYGPGSEHAEQVRLVRWARMRWPDVPIAAIPNGGARTKRDGMRLKAEGLLPGYPDLTVDCARGGYFGFRLEMKREKGGRVSPEQRRVMERLTAQGYLCAVARGADHAMQLLENYMALPPTGSVA